MELLIELFIDLILEGSVEISKKQKSIKVDKISFNIFNINFIYSNNIRLFCFRNTYI